MPVLSKPSEQELLKYARFAVRSEFAHPHHGRLSSYDNQAVLNDVLNHFPGLEVETDEDVIRDAVREAEQLEYPEHSL